MGMNDLQTKGRAEQQETRRSALMAEVLRVLDELESEYSFPFGEEIELIALKPQAVDLVYDITIHVMAESSAIILEGRADCFVPKKCRAVVSARLAECGRPDGAEVRLDETDGQLVVQKRLEITDKSEFNKVVFLKALSVVHRGVMAHYDELLRLQQKPTGVVRAHLKKYGWGWFCGVTGLALAVWAGHWALNHKPVREEPKPEIPSICAEIPLFSLPFRVMDEEGVCTAAENMAGKLLERQTQKYAELTELLRRIQEAESSADTIARCAVLLRDVDNIDTVLHRCRLSPSAHKRMETAVNRYQQVWREYQVERIRAMSAASTWYDDHELVSFLNGKKWGHLYYFPEDLNKLLRETLEYLEKVNEELKSVAAGKDSYAQAAAAFAERRAVPDDATIELALRWAYAGRMTLPQQEAEEQLRKEVLGQMQYAEWSIAYGESLEYLLYLRRIRNDVGEAALMKDWVDTYADMLLPLKLMLESSRNVPNVELNLDYLIGLYDALLARCASLPQNEDSEEMTEDIRSLYGQILYERLMLADYLEVCSPHDSCLLRLLLNRMRQFAAYREDKHPELASLGIETYNALTDYETFKVFDNVEPENAVPPMPLMSQILYSVQLSHEQRALEALRDICDTKSADAAAEVCAAALRKRRICTALRGVLSLSPEESTTVMTEVGNDAEMWSAALDAELERFRQSPNAGRGSEKLAAVLSVVDEPAMEMDALEDLLTMTEELLSYMQVGFDTEDEPSPATFHKDYFTMVSTLAQRWLRPEYQQQPMSREQLEMYEYCMERMVGKLKPFVRRYMKFDTFADSLGVCARLLPPVRKAIAVEMMDKTDSRYAHIAQAKAAAEEILAIVQQVSNAESARAVLPTLRQSAERLRTLQMDHLEFLSRVDGLMWPDVLWLRLLHHEITVAADALRAANNCHGCAELDRLLKEITQDWIPNLSSGRASGNR